MRGGESPWRRGWKWWKVVVLRVEIGFSGSELKQSRTSIPQ